MSQHSHLYQNARWRKRRLYQLTQEPLCRYCKELYGRATPATVADHTFPHRGDAELFEGELISLCASCHSSVKQAHDNGKLLKGCDASGLPVDQFHHWFKG